MFEQPETQQVLMHHFAGWCDYDTFDHTWEASSDSMHTT